MAHPSLVINTVQYSNVPSVQIPKVGGGTATFYDASEETVTAGDMLNGVKAIGAGGEVTGNIATKAAATYTPSNTAQTIAGQQYLAGAQTIEAVVCSNLVASNIKSGVVVKVGTASDDDSVANITGSLTSVSVTQDATSKILSIS